MKKYDVLKAHTAGAVDYARGDTRELTEADAKALVDMGALAEAKEKPAAKKAKA